MPCTLNFNMNIWKKTLIFIITYFWIIIKKLNNSVKNRFCLIILVFYNFTFQKYNTKIQFLLEVIFEFIDWSIFSTVNCILRHKNEGCIIFMFVYTIYGKKKNTLIFRLHTNFVPDFLYNYTNYVPIIWCYYTRIISV